MFCSQRVKKQKEKKYIYKIYKIYIQHFTIHKIICIGIETALFYCDFKKKLNKIKIIEIIFSCAAGKGS